MANGKNKNIAVKIELVRFYLSMEILHASLTSVFEASRFRLKTL